MDLFDHLRSISTKLGISQQNALLIFDYHRNCLNMLGKRIAMAIVDDIVTRFGLADDEFQKTYGEQLVAKGTLTPEESLLFSQGIYDATRTTAQDNTITA